MAAKLGSTDVSFRLGATTPAAVYLGSEQVWSAATVPGAPTNLAADAAYLYFDAPSDGGSPITEYRLYRVGGSGFDGFYESTQEPGGPFEYDGDTYDVKLYSGSAGGFYAVTAVNAIGEGPLSESIETFWL